MGLGNANFAATQQQVQSQLMNNPDFMRQMMDNPMVQSLMSNPDVIRELMMSNPQMRELMERNPEIQHMLNNPQLMRETMELARNPAALQELMRHHDRAMSNLESVPGGFNALQRIYRELEEPMMNATLGSQNPFAALVEGGGTANSTENRQAGTENTQPLPNPWGGRSSSATTTTSSTTSTTTSSTTSNPFGGLMGAMGGGGMDGYMQQMMQNPQQLESMMNTPHMQAMMQAMTSNPELSRAIVDSNPMLANAPPEMRDQMHRMMPQMMQQMANPEMRQALSNPEVMQALMQIQQGMQRLQTVTPPNFLTGYVLFFEWRENNSRSFLFIRDQKWL